MRSTFIVNVTTRQPDDLFLPDLCGLQALFFVLVFGELLAIVLVLAHGASPISGFEHLALVSLLTQLIALSSAAALCVSRAPLCRLGDRAAALASYLLVLATSLVVAELAWQLVGGGVITGSHGAFLGRIVVITGIVGAMALRYFYVQHHWRRQTLAESRARIQALQSRIRPHFFFNCMNTIAALTRSSPARAEQAVEDMADLFRASIADAGGLAPLRQELALTHRYLNIERLRLGERLVIEWDTDALPDDAHLPTLTVQPLLENAIYHGVEPLEQGGVIAVSGARNGDELTLSIENPVPVGGAARSSGNRLAQDNVAERLAAHFGPRGRLEIDAGDGRYRVTLTFPYISTVTTGGPPA
ncbi:MAG: histidine kinase [Gammaproteobacteria bacterium]|nr:histidine kinase [Gammaproteobacteria bacterium]